GAATTITRLPVGSPRGAAWMPDNTIVFATAGAATRRGLFKVSADGGEATPLTTPNRDRGEAWHSWPELLPGGHTLLFAVGRLEGRRDAANIAALDLRTGRYDVVVQGGTDPRYVSSGHLLYNAAGRLHAVAFDAAHAKVAGTPANVLANVLTKEEGASEYALAADGSLFYVAGPASGFGEVQRT